jgi:glucose uptake protein
MFVVHSYLQAVVLCVVTMVCWGSWANTQKLAGRAWPFQLFYWDYAIGVFLFSLVLAFTLGSSGAEGRGFLADLAQARNPWLESAFLGGVIFNVSNILLVAAIDVAGMAVAFPVGVGLALVLGVVSTYLTTREGNVPMLAAGVAAIVVAIVVDAIAYRRLAGANRCASGKGLLLAIAAGVLMGFFYRFVAQAMGRVTPVDGRLVVEHGKLTPYTAIVLFSAGVLVSNFLWNTIAMRWPFSGPRVAGAEYWKGGLRLHAVGWLGGAVWNTGLALSIIASTRAGAALSYGLGQGATMVGAFWGVFVWREFRGAPKGTGMLLATMFVFYLLGLAILVSSRS